MKTVIVRAAVALAAACSVSCGDQADWENERVNAINKQPPAAFSLPYPDVTSARGCPGMRPPGSSC